MPPFLTQPDNYTCGTYALLNVLRSLGSDSTRAEIKSLAHTTTRKGTTTGGIMYALGYLHYGAREYETSDPELAWRQIRRWASHRPIIALVDGREHYTVVSGVLDKKIIVIDSGANVLNGEMGAFPYSKQDWLRRWGHEGWYYCIVVSKEA